MRLKIENIMTKKRADMGKKVLSVLLSSALFFTSFDVTAFADNSNDRKGFFYDGKSYESVYDAIEKGREAGDKDIDITAYEDIVIDKEIVINEEEKVSITASKEETQTSGDSSEENDDKLKIRFADDYDFTNNNTGNTYLFDIKSNAQLKLDRFNLELNNEELILYKNFIYNRGEFIFRNSEIKNFDVTKHNGYSLLYSYNGFFDFYDSTVYNVWDMPFIKVQSDQSVTLYGGDFEKFNVGGGWGSFVCAEYGTLIAKDINVKKAYAWLGGAVCAKYLHIYNSYFKDCDGYDSGGALRIGNKGEIINCTFDDCYCSHHKTQNMAIDSMGTTDIYGVKITGTNPEKLENGTIDIENSGAGNAGGIFVQNGTLTLHKSCEYESEIFGKIKTNKNVIENTTQTGFAVSDSDTAVGIIEQAEFINNKSATNDENSRGGAINNRNELYLDEVTFRGNKSLYSDKYNEITCTTGDDIYSEGKLILKSGIKFEDKDNVNIFLADGKYITLVKELDNHFDKNTRINVALGENIGDDYREIVKYELEDDTENKEKSYALAYEMTKNQVWNIINLSDKNKLVSKDNGVGLVTSIFEKEVKVVNDKGEGVSNVTFDLYKKLDKPENGEEVSEEEDYKNYYLLSQCNASDEDGKFKIDRLTEGKYLINPKSVPEGYEMGKPALFSVGKNVSNETLEYNIGHYNEAPVAKIKIDKDDDEIVAFEDVTFDGSSSSDDEGITNYSWDFGDGETISGSNRSVVKHHFNVPGMYLVKLTVRDKQGRSNEEIKEINVSGDGLVKVTVNVKSTDDDSFIPKSYVYVTDENNEKIADRNSPTGVFEFVIQPGKKINISASAEGYYTRTTTATCEKNGSITLYLSSMETIKADINAKDLTLDEIIAAGIDVNDPDNKQVVKYELDLSFVPIKGPVTAHSFSLYFNATTKEVMKTEGDSEFHTKEGKVRLESKCDDKNGNVYLMIIRGTNTWLKDMFEVELVVLNSSTVEIAKDVKAKIILPDGLSLAKMVDNSNSEVHDLSDIDTGKSASTVWYVRGDVDGEYYINAEVSGKMHKKENQNNGSDGGNNNQENEIEVDDYPFHYNFTSSSSVSVMMQSALGVVIDLESTASTGGSYTVRFNYFNKSPKSILGLKFDIDEEIQISPGCVTYGGGTLSVGEFDDLDHIADGSLPEGKKIEGADVDELKPGEFVCVTYRTTCTFLDANEKAVTTMLAAYALSILPGSTAGMDVYFTVHTSDKDSRNFDEAMNSDSIDLFAADPVNLLTGALESEFTDLHISGYRDLDFIRYYNSIEDNKDENNELYGFGRGWSHNYDYKIINYGVIDMPKAVLGVSNAVIDGEEIANKDQHKNWIQVKYPNGKRYVFRKVADGLYNPNEKDKVFDDLDEGIYTSDEGLTIEVVKSNNKVSKIKMNDKGVVYTFDSNRKLISIEDVEGFKTKLTYDGGFLKTISNDVGSIDVEWNFVSGTITSIKYNDISIEYEYENKNLISEKNANGDKMLFTYVKKKDKKEDKDSSDGEDELIMLLETITDYEGQLVLENRYDEDRRVLSQNTGGKGTFVFIYDDKNMTNTQTGFKDYKRVIKYNDLKQVISDEQQGTSDKNVNKNKVTYEYNALGLPVIINENGQKKYISYNACQDISGIVYGNKKVNGSRISEEFEYDTNDTYLLTGIKDKNGVKTKYSYKNNLLSEKVDGKENIVSYTYDSKNRLHTEVQNGKTLRTISYNDAGRIKSIKDAGGFVTSFDYDELGNVSEVTDAKGGKTYYKYDGCGNLCKEIDAYDRAIEYILDKNGNVKGVIDRRNNSDKTELNIAGDASIYTDRMGKETKYNYDSYGHLLNKVNPDETKVKYAYDSFGNVISKTDENNGTWMYEYDEYNRVVRTTDPCEGIVDYEYDPDGNVISKKYNNNDGYVESFEYDNVGRIKVETDKMNNQKIYDYDSNGNLTSYTDENNITTTYSYDEENNLISSSVGDKTTSYEYDERGNVKKVTVSRTYVEDNKPVTESHTKEYEYDFRGNVITFTDELNNKTLYTYDEVGNLTETLYWDGTTVENTYDENGNILSTTDRRNNTVSYEYDKEDRVTKEDYGNGRTIEYEYDYAGRVCKKTYSDDREESYKYDGVGNLSTVTTSDSIIRYTRDKIGRVLTETIEDRNNKNKKDTVVTYEYDDFGNVKSKDDGVLTTFEYDKNGRVTKKVVGNNEYSYEYDGRGNVTREVYNTGKVVDYKYNNDNLVVEKRISYSRKAANRNKNKSGDGKSDDSDDSDGDGDSEPGFEEIVYSYEYDLYGNLIKYTDGCGNETKYTYDAIGNNLSITDALGNKTEFTYNVFEHTVTKKSSGTINEKYTYDANDNLVELKDSNDNIVRFEYDEYNNMTFKIEVSADGNNNRVTSYDYDVHNRCTKVTNPDESYVEYKYNDYDKVIAESDINGNTTSYEYDYKGNLIKVKKPEGNSISYTYDDNNNLTEIKKAKGIVTKYSYDECGNVKTETDNLKNENNYAYDCFGNVLSEKNAKGSIFYAYDLNGNVISKKVVTGKNIEENYYVYDKNDKLKNISSYTNSSLNNSISIIRDELSNITSVSDGKNTVGYTYDKDNNKKTVAYPNGDVVTYDYDKNGNIKTVKTPKNSYEIKYNEFNEAVSKTAGDLVETYEYDSLGRRIKTYENKVIKEKLEYNKLGYLAEKYINLDLSKDNDFKSTKDTIKYLYSYDRNGRLSSEIKNANSKISRTYYTYDGNDNIVKETRGKDVVNYVYDKADRLTSRTEAVEKTVGKRVVNSNSKKTTYTYDKLGNLISEKSSTYQKKYSYNADSRMVSSKVTNTYAESSKNKTKINETITNDYLYNALGLLDDKSTRKTIKLTNSKTSSSLTGKESLDKDYAKEEAYLYDYTNENPTILNSDINVSTTKNINTEYEAKNVIPRLKVRQITLENTEENYTVSSNYVYENDEKLAVNISVDSKTNIYKKNTTSKLGNKAVIKSGRKNNEDKFNDEYSLLTDNKGSVTKAVDKEGNKVAEVRYGSYGNVEEFDVNNKKILKDLSTTGLISEAELSSESVLTEELKNSDIVPSYTSYVYSDELRSLQDKEIASYVTNNNIADNGANVGNNIYTTWYAYERFYDSLNKRFESKDPIVGSIYEPERVNSYIYAGDNPLIFADRDGRSFVCDIANSRTFKKAVEIYKKVADVTNKLYKSVKPVLDVADKIRDNINDKIPSPVKAAIGAAGFALALYSGAEVGGMVATFGRAIIKGAISGAISYSLKHLATGDYNSDDLGRGMLDGMADELFQSGIKVGAVPFMEYAAGLAHKAGRFLADERGGEISFNVNGTGNHLFDERTIDISFSNKITRFLGDETGEISVGKTSYGKSSRNLSKPKGWKVGEPIDNLTKAGNEPSWSTVRARYWKNKAYYYGDDYLESDLLRMRKGKAPIDMETGASMELHHKKGRDITNPHNIENLQEVWPWEHDEIDPYRHYTGPRPKGE